MDTTTEQQNNKRIAKNTLLLYFRLFITMAVSLYTSRVVLQALGVEDFGIYNVVGGVVVLFSFFNVSMSSATQRFLNFYLGKNNDEMVEKTFSTAMSFHIVVSIFMVLLAETIGYWFLNYKLNIPTLRLHSANIVYQFSIISAVFGILQVPYNASVIAHEKMSFYAFLGILEAILKLVIVLTFSIGEFDKLEQYGFLIAIMNFILLAIRYVYCKKEFGSLSAYRPLIDKRLIREMVGFFGWSLFGSVANVGKKQGLNMVINIFCGVGINAAVGIADKVSVIVYQFVSSFQTAFQPQIVKSFSSNDFKYFHSLIIRGAKFSYYLLFFIFLPFVLNLDFILKLWLVEVPDYTKIFCFWFMIHCLIDALSGSLWMSIQATGVIRNYQIIVSTIILLTLPFSIIALRLGAGPESAAIIYAMVNLLSFVWRIFYVQNKIKLSAITYLKKVVSPVFLTTILAIIVPVCLKKLVLNPSNVWINFLVLMTTSILCVAGSIYFIGLSKGERTFVKEVVLKKVFKQGAKCNPS